MREYERRLVEAHGETGDGQGASPVGLQHGARAKLSDATSSSAQDQGSEDSVSDVPVSVPHKWGLRRKISGSQLHWKMGWLIFPIRHKKVGNFWKNRICPGILN